MSKLDPIIAVSDVEISSNWYQSVFNWRSMHGGKKFDILLSEENEVALCLHKWGEDEHPSMMDPAIKPGNGLILYFRTRRMNDIRDNLRKMEYDLAEEIHLNPNTTKEEFSVKDPDGYYITITEFHEYKG